MVMVVGLLNVYNRYAKELLQKELLPHLGVKQYCEPRKAYFIG